MKKIIIIGAIISSILVGLVSLVIFEGMKRNSPLTYCLREIRKHEGYEEFSYTYEQIKNADTTFEPHHHIYSYYINTFTDAGKGEWFCYVEAVKQSFFISNSYLPEEIIIIDCDLAFETTYVGEE